MRRAVLVSRHWKCDSFTEDGEYCVGKCVGFHWIGYFGFGGVVWKSLGLWEEEGEGKEWCLMDYGLWTIVVR
jgi:hypothetical protein